MRSHLSCHAAAVVSLFLVRESMTSDTRCSVYDNCVHGIVFCCQNLLLLLGTNVKHVLVVKAYYSNPVDAASVPTVTHESLVTSAMTCGQCGTM